MGVSPNIITFSFNFAFCVLHFDSPPLRVCADFIGIAAKLIKAFLVTFFSKKVTDKSKFDGIIEYLYFSLAI